MTAVTALSPTGNPYIDGLLEGEKWATTTLTFSFPQSASYYGTGYGSGELTNHFAALNATQMGAARAALGMYAAVANLTFAEISETSSQHATLRFARSDAPSTAWGYTPETYAEAGDSWYNNSSGYYTYPTKGNYAWTTFIHEIGHTLGL